MAEVTVPDVATSIRLVRPVGDYLREYEAMEAIGGSISIRRLLRQQMVRPGDYGLADLLDDNGDIVGEVELDRASFRRVKSRLRWRVVTVDG